ncbi:MAG: hypothetical protein LQ338_007672 [Usnochroma carphineum]|nr:MAG: hypothetical protein LQ338_007672 [Usnochroma carphineum]
MAEVLFDDEDEDDFWIEDPYAEADNLAEHTMHSPVLVNYDAALDFDDGWTDWEYYSDDFFDYESPKPKRRKIDNVGNGAKEAPDVKKRRMSTSMSNLPGLSLGEPAFSAEETHPRSLSTVVWKVRGSSPKLPILEDGQEAKVSILKDWRERFKLGSRTPNMKSTSPGGYRRAVAVVIQTKPNNGSADESESTTAANYSSAQKGRRTHPEPRRIDSLLDTESNAGNHMIGPPRKKSKVERSLSPKPPEPVLANGVHPMKRKRQFDETDEPITTKRTRVLRGYQNRSENNAPHQPTNGIEAQEAIGDTKQHKSTERPSRKRKLMQEAPDPEPVPKKGKSNPSDEEAPRRNLRAKPTAAAVTEGKRSTRRK